MLCKNILETQLILLPHIHTNQNVKIIARDLSDTSIYDTTFEQLLGPKDRIQLQCLKATQKEQDESLGKKGL